MRRVVLESPYAAEDSWKLAENIRYAQRCVRDSLLRGEAPIASHLLYTQDGILNDFNPSDRFKGIAAGHTWISCADVVVVYTDRRISPGMVLGINLAKMLEIPIEYRRIGEK